MDLSVIIVNWNTKKLLENCLSSIYKYTKARSFARQSRAQDDRGEGAQDDKRREKGINFEVIVVDNGSKDGSSNMVKEKFPQVKLILNKDNLGFTKANNQGIKIAKGRYVMLLNSDTYLIENALGKLVKRADELSKTKRGPTPLGGRPLRGPLKGLGALGPLLLNENRRVQQSVGFFPHLPQVFWWMSAIDDLPIGTIFKPYHVDHDSFYKNDHEVDWVTGAAILVPKRVIGRVGDLDEQIFMYGEEVDWCYRIKRANFKVFYSPTTKVVHIGRGSTGQVTKGAILGEYRGIKYFYAKHKSGASLQLLRLLLKIGALARIAAFSVLGRKETAKFYAEAFKMA